MKLTLYQADAFTEKLFGGNPAAIVPLQEWLPDGTLQQIALENNLSETAFFKPNGNSFDLRWFTPAIEVDLCGHATLASAHILFNHMNYPENEILFKSRSGSLNVRKDGEWLTLDFPVDNPKEVDMNSLLEESLRKAPLKIFRGRFDYMAVYAAQDDIIALRPDFKRMKELGQRGVVVTASGTDVDFVSRYFAPAAGIDEDPVTGSTHCLLTPFWASVTGKNELTARQLSSRGGYMKCKLRGDRVEMSGKAVTYLIGEIYL